MANFQKRYDPEVQVYDEKFNKPLMVIKELLKGYQHSLSVLQKEENGTTTSLEVTIVLKK
ncbi:MAG: hypothetical protein WC554_17755 [Clostridia bacterium]